MEKIIVVMATYNGEKYIRDQIDSLLAQEDVNMSILIRDDGSSDATQAILQQYSEQDKIVWYQGKHINVADGFMELLKIAPEADYYAFCDQDDIWLKDKLRVAVDKLKKEDLKKPLMYYSATTLVDENLNVLAEHHIHENRTDKARFIINDMSGNTIVINQKLKEELCAIDNPDIYIHDRWALQVCLALGGECIADFVSHIMYRQHGENTIGMELSFKDKIKKFIKISNAPHDKHFDALWRGYKKKLQSPYKEIIEMSINRPINMPNRIGLAMDKDINFADPFFNLAIRIKILRGNL